MKRQRGGSRRRDIGVASALIAAAVVLGGWSYQGLFGSEPPAAPPTTTTTAAPVVTAPPDISQLAAYIDEHFAETPWYQAIVRYEPMGSSGVAVLTSLTDAAMDQAVGICRAASFWRPGDGLPVLVRGLRGAVLVESPSGDAEECKAA